MNSDWTWVRLGDHCSKIGSGATPTGGKDSYLSSGPFCLIRSQNVYNDGFTPSGLAYISNEQAKKLDGVTVQENDVLLNITGDSVARVCLAEAKYLPARVNQHVAIIRPNPEKLDSRFLRYFLASPFQQDVMLGLAAVGATRNALTKVMIENFKVPCPPIIVQSRIAEILGSLDDRIALLRETNATLEAIAQALFKSWFVDFDPVHANAGTQPPSLPPEIQAIFPTTFTDSAQGLIPSGWALNSLDEVAHFLNGLALQKFPPNGDEFLPVIKIAQLRKGETSGADRASRDLKPEYIIQDGDVLFSWSGSLEVAIWCGGEGALNQHLFKVTSDKFPKWFYLLWTKHHLPNFQKIAASKATTMGHIQRKHLTEALVLIPSSEVLKAADEVFAPLIDAFINNSTMAANLSQLRDTLLPRLMSGELCLFDADQAIEEFVD